MEENKNNPFKLFKEWYEKWHATGVAEPEAMIVATADTDGQPSARVLLLKLFDERGFVFFTNYTSRKAHELETNPKASLCFYWEEIGKQVRVEGRIEKISDHESDAYFEIRPRESQVSAWASKQSHEIKSQEEFKARIKEIAELFKGEPIPRPPFWGGYRVVPERIEFWQRGEHRLHTRLLYVNKGGKWETSLLYP